MRPTSVAARWRDCSLSGHAADSPSSSRPASHRATCTIFEIDAMCMRNVSSRGSRSTPERWWRRSPRTSESQRSSRLRRAGALVHLNMFVILMVSGRCRALRIHGERFGLWIDGSPGIRGADWTVNQAAKAKPVERKVKRLEMCEWSCGV